MSDQIKPRSLVHLLYQVSQFPGSNAVAFIDGWKAYFGSRPDAEIRPLEDPSLERLLRPETGNWQEGLRKDICLNRP